MIKFYYKIDYIYNGNEDFMIISSSDILSINQITDFALGVRDNSLFKEKEIWELNYDKDKELIPFSLARKLF